MDLDFDEIYKIYSPRIFRVCLGFFNDHEIAKDFTQETFISVWKNLNQFENRSDIGTWIYRIATNKCLRRIKFDSVVPEKVPLPEDLKYEAYNFDKEEKLAALQKYISELPEIDRIITTLSLEEVPQEKIAEIIGISHANVRVKFHRIKEKLMRRFNENGRL